MKQDLRDRIARLKEERNAVVLAHNYQIGDVQDLADYTGDSLGLARKASEIDADVIVFCGVYFMAETASMLNPDKLVLIPEKDALCPMAQMIDGERVRKLKAENPEAAVVAYVNTTAEVKALTDVCCTSSNAVDVVRSIEADRPVIFVPDRNLGNYVARQTGRELILSDGYCPTHVRILPENISDLRSRYPEAEVMVHPECLPAVVDMADVVTSTGGMVRHAKETDARTIVVGTEVGLLHRLRRENVDKEFLPATNLAVCPNMKKIRPQSILWSLEDMQYEVKVPEKIAEPARQAVSRMLSVPPSQQRKPAKSRS